MTTHESLFQRACRVMPGGVNSPVRAFGSVGGTPPSALWATDPAGFDQVGCVYTAQGFEYDWNGVILLIQRKKGNSGGSVVSRYA